MKYKLTAFLLLLFPLISKQVKGIYMQENQTNFENSVFAIVKISFNKVGETPVEGGICGTAFLINDSTAITANHVLNGSNYLPNPGYKYVQYWLMKRGTKKIIELKKDDLQSLPEIESTFIKLNVKFIIGYNLCAQVFKINDFVLNYGHISNMPITKAHWENKLIIDDYTLEMSKSDKMGTILSLTQATINSQDLHIIDKAVIQPSFIANIGMSGGPLISQNNIIGLMSFGLPADSTIKKEVYAISINEVIKLIKK